MCFNKPIMCFEFPFNQKMRLHFIGKNAVCEIKKKKTITKINIIGVPFCGLKGIGEKPQRYDTKLNQYQIYVIKFVITLEQ